MTTTQIIWLYTCGRFPLPLGTFDLSLSVVELAATPIYLLLYVGEFLNCPY